MCRSMLTFVDTPERVIERYYNELFNRGAVELVDELLHPDYVNHSPGSATMSTGRDGVAGVVVALRVAFPDLHYSIEDLVVGNNAVAARTIMTGTHEGDLFGVAPTGRSVQVNQLTVEHFRGGQIVAHWRLTDDLAMMRQLGTLS